MFKFNLRDEEKNRARFLGNEANERFVCEFNGLSRTVKKLRKVTPPRAVRSPHPPLHERRLDAAGGLRRTSATSRSSHEMALIWAAALMPATRGLRAGEPLCLPLKSVAALTHPKAGLVEPGYFGQNEAKGPLSCHFNAPLRPPRAPQGMPMCHGQGCMGPLYFGGVQGLVAARKPVALSSPCSKSQARLKASLTVQNSSKSQCKFQVFFRYHKVTVQKRREGNTHGKIEYQWQNT